MFFFFFNQKTSYEMRISDWSSDVCSSDLALADLQANVAGQEALLGEAQRAAAEAREAHAAATAAVEAKQAEIEQLRADIREFAVQAFVHPPADDDLAALDSSDPGDAAEKRPTPELPNPHDTALLDRPRPAGETLAVPRPRTTRRRVGKEVVQKVRS